MQKQRKKRQKERKKKEREEEEEVGMATQTDPGRRPRPCATRSPRDPGRGAIWVFFFFFPFFSDERVAVVFLLPVLNVNRVLETRFSCRRHVEKVPHQTGTDRKSVV